MTKILEDGQIYERKSVFRKEQLYQTLREKLDKRYKGKVLIKPTTDYYGVKIIADNKEYEMSIKSYCSWKSEVNRIYSLIRKNI